MLWLVFAAINQLTLIALGVIGAFAFAGFVIGLKDLLQGGGVQGDPLGDIIDNY